MNSILCMSLVTTTWLVIYVLLILSCLAIVSWLDYMYFFSYVKLGVTLVKYVPQAYMNWYRKSTLGWSIYQVLLDFTGGIFSIAQPFLDAINNGTCCARSRAAACWALIRAFSTIDHRRLVVLYWQLDQVPAGHLLARVRCHLHDAALHSLSDARQHAVACELEPERRRSAVVQGRRRLPSGTQVQRAGLARARR